MTLNDLLKNGGIDPCEVLVLRHVPIEPKLRKVLPWLVEKNHDVFNAYQQTQGPIVEKAMQRAKFVASFIGHEPGKALFAGLYRVKGFWPLSFEDYWKVPANTELRDKYGLAGLTNSQGSVHWFELALLDFRSDWKGKLIVRWPGKELSWHRWAANNEFEIFAIAEHSVFERTMPAWNQLILNCNEVRLLPKKWREELSRWRGIYFIFDESDCKGYVGAAYGSENLYGRWMGYAKSGHGGNKYLRGRDPENFRFSILQIVPHDMSENDVQFTEATWKQRLHTREFGLNGN